MSKASKKIISVVPKFEFPITFKKGGKKFRVNVKLFKKDEDLNEYYNDTVSAAYRDPNGILAGAIFSIPTRENKNTIGEVIFSLGLLHPSIIAHEATHIVFQYFECEHGLNFATRRKEETFCDVLEVIIDGIYKYLIDNNIKFNAVPGWYKSTA